MVKTRSTPKIIKEPNQIGKTKIKKSEDNNKVENGCICNNLSTIVEKLQTISNRFVAESISDSYDKFSKYISSLLRGLPKKEALELEKKIVNDIVEVMNAYKSSNADQSSTKETCNKSTSKQMSSKIMTRHSVSLNVANSSQESNLVHSTPVLISGQNMSSSPVQLLPVYPINTLPRTTYGQHHGISTSTVVTPCETIRTVSSTADGTLLAITLPLSRGTKLGESTSKSLQLSAIDTEPRTRSQKRRQDSDKFPVKRVAIENQFSVTEISTSAANEDRIDYSFSVSEPDDSENVIEFEDGSELLEMKMDQELLNDNIKHLVKQETRDPLEENNENIPEVNLCDLCSAEFCTKDELVKHFQQEHCDSITNSDEANSTEKNTDESQLKVEHTKKEHVEEKQEDKAQEKDVGNPTNPGNITAQEKTNKKKNEKKMEENKRKQTDKLIKQNQKDLNHDNAKVTHDTLNKQIQGLKNVVQTNHKENTCDYDMQTLDNGKNIQEENIGVSINHVNKETQIEPSSNPGNNENEEINQFDYSMQTFDNEENRPILDHFQQNNVILQLESVNNQIQRDNIILSSKPVHIEFIEEHVVDPKIHTVQEQHCTNSIDTTNKKKLDVHQNKNVSNDNRKQESDNEDVVGINAAKKKNGKRMRDKVHCCKYCLKLVICIGRHIKTVHKDELEVAHILANDPLNRKFLLEQVEREGDYNYNKEVLAIGSGELILVRRPTEAEMKTHTFEDYGPCTNCLGFMLKTHIWHHVKYGCKAKKATDTPYSARLGTEALLRAGNSSQAS